MHIAKHYLPLALSGLLCAAPIPVQAQVAAPTTPPPAAAAPAAPTPAPLPPPAPFEQALMNAANDLFTKVKMPDGTTPPSTLVIDPLIDGSTGIQSIATRSMERRIVDLVRASYKSFDVKPFSTDIVAKQPVVLVGTFTPISLKPDGPRR